MRLCLSVFFSLFVRFWPRHFLIQGFEFLHVLAWPSRHVRSFCAFHNATCIRKWSLMRFVFCYLFCLLPRHFFIQGYVFLKVSAWPSRHVSNCVAARKAIALRKWLLMRLFLSVFFLCLRVSCPDSFSSRVLSFFTAQTDKQTNKQANKQTNCTHKAQSNNQPNRNQPTHKTTRQTNTLMRTWSLRLVFLSLFLCLSVFVCFLLFCHNFLFCQFWLFVCVCMCALVFVSHWFSP